MKMKQYGSIVVTNGIKQKWRVLIITNGVVVGQDYKCLLDGLMEAERLIRKDRNEEASYEKGN